MLNWNGAARQSEPQPREVAPARKAPANARTIKDSAKPGTISRSAARAAVRAVMARRSQAA